MKRFATLLVAFGLVTLWVTAAIILPDNAKVVINDAQGVTFKDIKLAGGTKPQYAATRSTNISY